MCKSSKNSNSQININISGGSPQVIMSANKNTVIQNNTSEAVQLEHLINDIIMNKPTTADESQSDEITENLMIIKEETSQPSPNKSRLKEATTALKAIKGTVEFGAAVTTLIQFVQMMLT